MQKIFRKENWLIASASAAIISFVFIASSNPAISAGGAKFKDATNNVQVEPIVKNASLTKSEVRRAVRNLKKSLRQMKSMNKRMERQIAKVRSATAKLK